MTVLLLGMEEGVEDVFFLLSSTHSALVIKVLAVLQTLEGVPALGPIAYI